MDLKQAELILMDNLKGSKNKKNDILSIAKAVNVVKNHYTTSDIKTMFEITPTSVNRINAINKLNTYSKKLIKQRKIKIEQTYHLSRLDGKRQDEAARIVASMNAHNSRIFVNMLLAQPTKTVKECKNIFDKSRNDDISLAVVPMPNDVYNSLERIATKNKKEPQDIILQLVEDYIGR